MSWSVQRVGYMLDNRGSKIQVSVRQKEAHRFQSIQNGSDVHLDPIQLVPRALSVQLNRLGR